MATKSFETVVPGQIRARRWLRVVKALWRRRVVRGVDHAEVTGRVNEDDRLTGRYALLASLSAGIAVLGLLTASSPVVIGAMLVSPLMGPILGLGFALAGSDLREMRHSLVALGVGTLLAVGLCALIVTVSPLKAVTPEILARTRPNLFDLVIAVFSALAGTYATIKGKGATIVGVAIATALMPPLAVVGYGLATRDWRIFVGSAELFATNAVAIALTAAVVAKLYGFGSASSHASTRLQTILLLAVFVALAVPLGVALERIAWETHASSDARGTIIRYFGARARVTELDLDFTVQPIVARAVVLTPKFRTTAGTDLDARIARALGKAVEMRLSQIVIGPSETRHSAEQRAVKAAHDLATAETSQAPDAGVADRLRAEVVAATGTSADRVTIDADARRAAVAAAPRADMTLAAWRDTELRIAAAHSDWTIALAPPLAPLPLVRFAPRGANLDSAAVAALNTAAWAIGRWRAADIAVIGRAASRDDGRGGARALAKARADAVLAALAVRGIMATTRIDPVGPRQRAAEREQGRALFRSVEITMAGAPPRLP